MAYAQKGLPFAVRHQAGVVDGSGLTGWSAVKSYRDFGRLLRERRTERGWSQPQAGREVARASKNLGRTIPNVAQATFSKWESGRCPPLPWLAYAICGAFQITDPANLALHEVLTPPVLAEFKEETRRYRLSLLCQVAPHSVRDDAADAPRELDWERLTASLRNLRAVDAVVVEDQWLLTRQYHAAIGVVSCRTMLDLLGAHLARLRQLRNMATDDRHRLEFGVMICQTAIKAGMLSTGLTDFGLAMEAFKYCIEVAEDMHDDTLAATGLILQAQLYGGLILPQLASSPSRIVRLIDESQARSSTGTSTQAQVFLHATRSGLRALLRDEAAARRHMELARRAEAATPKGTEHYFAMTTPDYRLILEATVTMALDRPERAIDIYTDVAGRTEERNTLAWIKWSLAAAYARAQEPSLAGPATEEALQLARQADSPFLVRGVESVAEMLVSRHGQHPAVRRLAELVWNEN